jgi:RimJ/RimL family protein N-acetyltransferase
MSHAPLTTGFAPVRPVVLNGRYLRLEPFNGDAHIKALWDALGQEGIDTLLQFFPQEPFKTVDKFADWLMSVQSQWVTLVAIDQADNAVTGMASYMRIDPHYGVVEVGSVAHGSRMGRSALSTEMHYLMAKHVFEDLKYRRYEWKCHNENEPSKRAALRYGFTYEGLFRQHMISKGQNRDTAWFSMIDADWPVISSAFEAWLDPANFDSDGQQKRKLEDIRKGLL